MSNVMFVCIHNAGRSQMAAGIAKSLADSGVTVTSAGTRPDTVIHPSGVAVLAENGIDISAEKPKQLTKDSVAASDIVVIMGAGDISMDYPGAGAYLQWDVKGAPSGGSLADWRIVRDEIECKVRVLLDTMGELAHPVN